MTTVYVIIAIIFLALWTWGVLLFGKHNQNKVNALQAETNKAYAAAKQKLEAEVLSLKAKLAAK